MNTLSDEEVKRLRKKLKLSIIEHKYDDLANFHGAPLDICDGEPCCPHGDPKFLAWHRLYMVNMEEMLDEGLPYWDWTEDTHIPQLWENITVPFKKGANSSMPAEGRKGVQIQNEVKINHESIKPGLSCPPGDTHFVRRAIDIAFDTDDFKKKTKSAYFAPNLISFQKEIEEPHNQVHVN